MFFVLMTILVAVLKPLEARWAKRAICDLSVRLRASSLTAGLGSEKLAYELRCPIIDREIQPEELYPVVTEELESCWSRLGAGQGSLISSYSLQITDPKNTPTACVVCAKIYSKDQELTYSTKAFEQHITKDASDHDKQFMNAIVPESQKKGYFLDSDKTYQYKDVTFTQDKPLLIAYFIYKTNSDDSEFQGITAGGTAGFFGRKAIYSAATTLGRAALTRVGIGAGVVAAGGTAVTVGSVAVLAIPFVVAGGADTIHKDFTVQGMIIAQSDEVLATCDRQL